MLRPPGVRQCPRCGYQGEGIPYFKRPGHIGLLVGVSLFTYGFGGLVYWFARRRHLVCPRCGMGWEHASRALAVTVPAGNRDAGGGNATSEVPLPGSGVKRRIAGVVLLLLASLLVLIGVSGMEIATVAVGAVLGAGGSATFYWGWRALQSRREALLQGLQRQVLKLAQARGGTLTVTEVAADMNLSLPAAEKVLMAMDDGFRVRSEISKDGVLYYEFPEVLHREELGPGA
ncbi:MAG: hypothetical protein ACE5GJ_01280 [Gemmatimonadota bacterium]